MVRDQVDEDDENDIFMSNISNNKKSKNNVTQNLLNKHEMNKGISQLNQSSLDSIP